MISLRSAGGPIRCLGRWVPLAAIFLTACPSENTGTPRNAGQVDNHLRDVAIDHEPCERAADSHVVDVNGDQKPDIIHVMKDGREACRVVDLNFDGTVDAYIYYDASGQERRRESDFDRDGRPDQITISVGGVVTENRRETNYDDKLDTWDHYEGGRLVLRERDSDGDAIVDQWWTYYDATRPRCARVATDRNADGKPDPDGQVDLCSGAAPPPQPPMPAPSASAAPESPSESSPPGGVASPSPSATSGGAP